MADELRILSTVPPSPKEAPSVVWHPGKIRKLAEIKAGHRVKFMAIQLAEPARGQLYAQGLIENRKARVIHNDHRGRVMLNLQGEIYLLGRRETAKIQVREYLPGHAT
ncbi:ferrous iron transport protein A [Kiritimatiellaeota bacterium B1221]|nr:ferrous iron transport protein A [Kiritimatiellaeota bacterium B1221]